MRSCLRLILMCAAACILVDGASAAPLASDTEASKAESALRYLQRVVSDAKPEDPASNIKDKQMLLNKLPKLVKDAQDILNHLQNMRPPVQSRVPSAVEQQPEPSDTQHIDDKPRIDNPESNAPAIKRQVRPLKHVTLDDFDASYSPLMRAAGLTQYKEMFPKSDFHGIGVSSAYVSFNATSRTIVVEIACAHSNKEGAPELLCAVFDKVSSTLLSTPVPALNNIHRRVTCVFNVSDSRLRTLELLPTRAFLLKARSLEYFVASRHWEVPSLNYFEERKMWHACAFSVQPFIKPRKPIRFLTGVTEVRTAADRLFDWITFHLQAGYDHIVIYDDKSTDNTLDVLYPLHQAGLVTYFNWTNCGLVSSTSAARQFLAMEDFAIRFGPQTELVSQFDDDFFIYVPPTNLDPDGRQPSLRQTLRYVLDKFPEIDQFKHIAKWFGACHASSSSGGSYIIEESLAAYPIYEKLVWRYDKVERTIPWVKSNRPANLITWISFARSHKIVSSHMSHEWRVVGDHQYIPTSCIVHNHYKVFSWADHQEKNKHTWLGSIANRTEHNSMNKLLCRVKDTYLADKTPELLAWSEQSVELMGEIVHSYSWPKAPDSLPNCDMPGRRV